MMRALVLLLMVMLFSKVNAQVGIGTETPNASAKLDVVATNKGFLPPRVTLTGVKDTTTIVTPAEGLLVYNLGSANLVAGYYYWNGSTWSNFSTGVTGAAQYGETGVADASKIGTTLADFPGTSITLPSAGVWRIKYYIFYTINTLNSLYAAVYDNNNNVVANSGSSSNGYYANSVYAVLTNEVVVTTRGPATYKLRGQTTGGTATISNKVDKASGGMGSSKIIYELISNYAASTSFNTGTTTISATTTAPTQGTLYKNSIMAVDNGKQKKISMSLAFDAGTGGSGDYLFSLPAGITFNTATGYNPTYTGTLWSNSVGSYGPYLVQASGTIVATSAYGMIQYIVPYSSTQFRIVATGDVASGIKFIGSGWFHHGESTTLQLTFDIW
jgi:hypothetical protein